MTRPLCFMTALALGLFYTPRAQAGCEKDTDCKGERVCEAGACVDPVAAPAAATTDDAPKEPVKEDSEDASEEKTEETEETEEKAEDSSEEKAEEETEEKAEGEATTTDPKDWWKQSARKAETPILQEIFNSMPRPVRKKGNAKLLYHRAVPVVVADIHNTTTLWGGKGQTNVRFMGISKVHSTTTMDPISETTPGIAYCPVNCDRITNITTSGQNISIMYDSEIKEWGGKASDVHAGYTRKVGKHHRAICTFPVLYNLAPASAWLDPEEVAEVQTSAVNELKRYCGK